MLDVPGTWHRVLHQSRAQLERVLPAFIRERRWFGARSRRIRSVEIQEVIPVPEAGGETGRPAAYITFVNVEFDEGDPKVYLIPMAAVDRAEANEIPPAARIVRLLTEEGERDLFDACWEPEFGRTLLDSLGRRRRLNGLGGKLAAVPSRTLGRLRGSSPEDLEPQVLSAEQSNTSLVYGDRLLLKLFRRLEPGENPDLEVGRFLTERGFPNIPPVAGWLDYSGRRGNGTVGIFQGFVANEGDAWQFTLDHLRGFIDEVLTRMPEENEPPPPPSISFLDLAANQPPEEALDLFGAYLETVRLLGRRTAELHIALASDLENPAFAPEPITPLNQRSLYQSMRAPAVQAFRLLRSRIEQVPQAVQIIDLENEVLSRFRRMLDHRIEGLRTRVHGDYHLGQVLYTGRDFVIIDFEGEPARPLGERRIKRSPLRDVAGMLRSFHYAAYASLFGHGGPSPEENPAFLEAWVLFWYRWVAAAFLRSYLDTVGPAGILPRTRSEIELLLGALLLEKAIYELRYEVDHRPDWVRIPIAGILQLLEAWP